MAKSKKTASGGTYTIAVDVGYGYTQAIDSNGVMSLQPSIYTHKPHELEGDELAAAQQHFSGLTFYDGDNTLLLGNLADAHSRSTDAIVRLTARENTADGNAARLLFVKMAAAQLNAGNTSGDAIHAQIVTGLPVDYLRDRAALKNALLGQHAITTDNTDFILNVEDVVIMPQPLGTVYSYRLDPSGAPADFGYDTVLCFDFGTLTAQIVTHTARSYGGGFIPARSFSVDAGAHVIRSAIYNWLEVEFGSRDMPLSEIDKAIRTGSLKIRGEQYDMSAVIAKAAEQILEIISRRANERIGSALTADIVVVSGGIAPLVFDRIAAQYGHAITFLADEPQWANVRGYLAFGQFKRV